MSKKEESTKQQDDFYRNLIFQMNTAYETKNQELLKKLTDSITSNPESVKKIIESTKEDPAVANAAAKAIAVSPALEESIRQIDPNSTLLPVEEQVTGGNITLEGTFYNFGPFEIQIKPNTVLKGGLNGGSPKGMPATSPGDEVVIGFYFMGRDVRSGPGIIEGRNYDKLYYDAEVNLGGKPIPPPNTNVSSEISSRFTFQAKIRVFTTDPFADPSAQMIHNYTLHGEGTVTVKFRKGEYYYPYLIIYKFDA